MKMVTQWWLLPVVFNSNGGVLSSIETGGLHHHPQEPFPRGGTGDLLAVCRDNSILPSLDKEKGGCASGQPSACSCRHIRP